MVLEGLKSLLARFHGRVRMIGQAVSADSAESLVTSLDPDIVVADVRLRGSSSGLDLCRRLVEADPDRKVVLLSAYDDEQYLFQALRAGAVGYLLKSIDGEGLVQHLERVVDGETALDPTMAGRAAASAARLQAGEFWPGARLGLTQRRPRRRAVRRGAASRGSARSVRGSCSAGAAGRRSTPRPAPR